MSSRRLQILVALACTGLWAAAIWFGHSQGHFRLIDRLESALTDLRTLARGVKPAPDLVTIVAIDDAIVKLGSTYPLPRSQIAKIVDAIARLEPKVIAVDPPAGRSRTRRWRCGAGEIIRGASNRAGGRRGISGHRSAVVYRQRRATRALAERRPFPASACGIRRACGSRDRQRHHGPDRHADVGFRCCSGPTTRSNFRSRFGWPRSPSASRSRSSPTACCSGTGR